MGRRDGNDAKQATAPRECSQWRGTSRGCIRIGVPEFRLRVHEAVGAARFARGPYVPPLMRRRPLRPPPSVVRRSAARVRDRQCARTASRTVRRAGPPGR